MKRYVVLQEGGDIIYFKRRVAIVIALLLVGSYSLAVSHAVTGGAGDQESTFNPLYDAADGAEIQLQDSTPIDPVSDEPITREQLVQGEAVTSLTANRHFAPSNEAAAPNVPFEGTLNIKNGPIVMSDAFFFGKGELHGKDTTVFPNVSVDFFTVHTTLVPTTQAVIANGTLEGTESYWDIIVQPGRVWQKPDGSDEGWNRASFPFALVNRLEGETHTGIAMFLYDEQTVSHVRFQVVAQTRPGEVPDYFNAWGVTEANYVPGIDNVQAHKDAYEREVALLLPTAPLSELQGKVSADLLAEIDGAADEKERHSVLQTALYYDGVIYRSPLHTAAGPFPYVDAARHGVWSVTKSAVLNVATLRLAEKYGAGLLNEKIADYIAVPDHLVGWDDVTFLDMANMASGRGGSDDNPTCYLCDYQRWNLAPSRDEKVAEALNYAAVWEPGTKYVYRDQDSFLLGAALESFLRSKEGDDASLAAMLTDEVFEPIGIFHLPANYTIEAGGADGQIKAEFGYYPTMDDMVKIGLLYQNHGAWNGEQILHRDLVDSLLPKQQPPYMALVKEEEADTGYGLGHYALNWHIEPYETADGCLAYLPSMSGFGGNLVTLMPNGIVTLRVANATSDFNSPRAQADVASQLAPFCSH